MRHQLSLAVGLHGVLRFAVSAGLWFGLWTVLAPAPALAGPPSVH